jgi:hypothetical protein
MIRIDVILTVCCNLSCWQRLALACTRVCQQRLRGQFNFGFVANEGGGLFTDTRAIGADWRFVGEELSIAANPFLKPIDRMSAGILGVGLGICALPKTLFQLTKPFGNMEIMMWYNISNQGVNNAPTIHKH